LAPAEILRVQTSGVDPQLHLPTLAKTGEELPLFVEIQARVKCELKLKQ
jgi:hypothetical protein